MTADWTYLHRAEPDHKLCGNSREDAPQLGRLQEGGGRPERVTSHVTSQQPQSSSNMIDFPKENGALPFDFAQGLGL